MTKRWRPCAPPASTGGSDHDTCATNLRGAGPDRADARRGGSRVRDLQFPDRMYGAGPPGDRRAAGHPGAVPRYRLPLRRDLRIPGPDGGGLEPEPEEPAS